MVCFILGTENPRSFELSGYNKECLGMSQFKFLSMNEINKFVCTQAINNVTQFTRSVHNPLIISNILITQDDKIHYPCSMDSDYIFVISHNKHIHLCGDFPIILTINTQCVRMCFQRFF